MEAKFLSGSYSPPSHSPVFGATDRSWLPTKSPATQTQHRHSFSIEAILSTGTRESAQQPAYSQQEVVYRASPPLPMWPAVGYEPANSPNPLLHYAAYHHHNPHPNSYNQVLYNGRSAVLPGNMCRINLLRRTCRRMRTIFTSDQLKRLEDVFSKQRYMTGTEKVLLASALRLSETQVKVWFQNRRTRWRKSNEDKTGRTQECNELNRDTSLGEEDELVSVDSDDSLES